MTTTTASQILTAAVTRTTTPAAAASSLAAPATAVLSDPQALEDALWDIWNAVLGSATQTAPERQGPLVDVLDAVKSLPSGDDGFEFWGERTTWEELPSLGMVVREVYGLEADNAGSGFVNLNAFAARLTAAGVCDLSLYGVWTLRSVLEDREPGEAAAQEDSRGLVSAAAWFAYAGKRMWEFSAEEKAFDGAVAIPGKSVAGQNWKGYSKARWELWVERFKKAQALAVAGDEKALVEKAVAEIDSIA
ncbi:hypothetical protein SLS58_011235 [Diplodia intermedia]|uniref:Uncharacterized protein n=1 Tax=Diplodia intermedia TaxID=856260 RepID=A0ABR3T0F2_9PEZI